DEVKNAYRKLARAYHPDFNPDPKAHERMATINAAFEVLSDPVRRMEYDATIGQAGNDEPTQTPRARQPEAVHATIRHRLRDHRTP
ncbi:DnaJ domain-containing protein, partial [Acinetobacter baumannii]